VCLLPLTASLNPEGGRPLLDPEGDIKLPCGKCDECISRRAVDWATRAKHEISEHTQNCFLTLTYNDENLNSDFIIKRDFQNFLKRLRKKENTKFRYMVSYEYGSKKFRPHMHAIIFGYNPPEQSHERNAPSGNPLFTSETISKLWTNKKGESMGFHSIAEANEKTAYYIASYALKGQSRTIIHEHTGEEREISDTMDVSRGKGIGLTYLWRNAQQLVNTGKTLPRYYSKKIEEYSNLDTKEKWTKNDYLAIQKFSIQDYKDMTDMYQERQAEKLATRSDHEIYAKIITNRQKTSLHSTGLRETYITDKKNNNKVHEQQFREQRLRQNRDNYVSLTRRNHDEKNVRNQRQSK
jgi:hypothetical protein